MSVKPWLHAPTVLGAALLVVGATACTTSSGANALPTTSTTLVTSSTAAPTTLPPATTTTVPPTTTTTTTTIAPEAQVVADFKATMAAFSACTASPGSCDETTVGVADSPYYNGLVKAIDRLDRNGLRGRPSPQSYLVVEGVELAADGKQATLRTCMVDAGVTYDPRGNDDPADDIIMDDSVASTRTVWTLTLTEAGWRRFDGQVISEKIGENQCPPPAG